MRVTVETGLAHGLTVQEYEHIESTLGRAPTIEELGVFSVMWSEHCSYKSSRVHLRSLPTTGPRVLQGPGENAGAIDVGDGLAVVFKIESHNHPSFVEPFQGAATGVGGILRDIFTMGARPIANLNSLRFGSIDHSRTAFLVRGVVAGIGHYGNCIGVPTVGGEVSFDPGYDHNILVNAFTLGVVQADRIFRARATGVGNPVMYVGSRTGRDGIHGASLLASAEFDAESESKRPTVQVGDPFTEKLLLEACLELMSPEMSRHLVAIQDMGAAGLTSSSTEMAARGDTGIDLDLSRVPLREPGVTPYEILLSESQERMLLVVRQGSEDAVKAVFDKWDLEAAVIGRVTDTRRLRCTFEGRVVVDLPIAPLTDDAPVYERPAIEPRETDESAKLQLKDLTEPADYNQTLVRLLESPNLCSREWVYRQYDSYVGGGTVVRPGSDAAVVRLPGTDKAVAMTVDCNSRLCLVDPYVGTVSAVAEAARNLAASGAEPIGVTNCLNFGSPEKPEVMWQFQQAIAGLRDACLAFGTPVISGNVSFYNETEGRSIPPTPVIGMVGLLEDASQHVTQWFKSEGDAVVLLGRNREELGSSEYLAVVHHQVRGGVPWIDLEIERRLIRAVVAAAREGLLRSAHDVAEGGLAVALAECCITSETAPPLGARVEIEGGFRPDALLFGESQARMIVSVRRRHLTRLREIARREEVPISVIGEVRGQRLEIGDLVGVDVATLRETWRTGLAKALAGSCGS
ncbi:MAG: phosphoribosylformylglycinamidine synthase subunit PurL [Deltaproteobacteria bacterium]|nr:phosphoribosylformylglycinamidine synthase subunit PurL [Deltaproteobacteria bacterium]